MEGALEEVDDRQDRALGDWLRDVFVVQFAAWLNTLTLRRIITFIPIVILVVAYDHHIPIPPTLMLVGDLLAYMDIFAAIFLISVLTRTSTILFVVGQAMPRARRLLVGVQDRMRRLDFRPRREAGAGSRKRLPGRPGMMMAKISAFMASHGPEARTPSKSAGTWRFHICPKVRYGDIKWRGPAPAEIQHAQYSRE